MNITEAKRIRIVDYLRLLGHEPKKVQGGQYWYCLLYTSDAADD